MTPNRSSPEMPKSLDKQNGFRCEPLFGRIDPLIKGRTEIPSLACTIACANTHSAWTLDPPFFTRLPAEAGLPLPAKRALISDIQNLQIAWLGDPTASLPTHRNRVASIQLDEPIDIASLDNAAAIELQLFGVPFHTYANSRLARWTPGLPIELSHFEQLAKKVNLLKSMTGGNCPVGAAMSPGSVYDDVRYLIDSGFDYITVLCQVQYGMSPSQALELSSLEQSVEQAVKALRDSGATTKLMIAGNFLDGKSIFRCLQMGASAVSIDAYLAHSKPKEIAPPKETLGSVLTAFAPPTSTTSFAWLAPAMTQLITELQDCALYAGSHFVTP